MGVLGKYLVVLSASFPNAEDASAKSSKPTAGGRQKTSAKRKRLHVLYLLNDLFHHTKYHADTAVGFSTLSGSLQPYIVQLVGYAASYDREKNPKHHRRLEELLDIWSEHGYYSTDYVNKLREVVKNSALAGAVKASVDTEESSKGTTKGSDARSVPFVMPATHGDPSMPYYDLPAGNLIPHMIPNSTAPLRPDSIQPLQFLAGPADAKLVAAVKAFLKDVDRIYGPEDDQENEEGVVDIDELGQTIIRDEITGEIINGETYYGWSRAFCQQMKKRNSDGRTRSRSRSHSQSRSRSRSNSSVGRRKRSRRYSDSAESDDSRWGRNRRGTSRRYSSYSQSPTPPRRRSRSPQSRERSYSPRPASPRPFPPTDNRPFTGSPAAIPPHPANVQVPPSRNYGQPQHQFVAAPPPLAPGMVPAPPPRPPNYNGPWPPPPPPPLTMGFPPGPGTGMPPVFPPSSFPGQGPFLPTSLPTAQPMPPGSYHFPQPYAGAGTGRPGGSWGQPGYPPAGRGWK